MTLTILQGLLIGALLCASSAFADGSIQIGTVNGRQQASFRLGDSTCVLVDETVLCAPIVVASS